MTDNKPLISVVVPVYNVEKYLNECVDSILAQTYENLEIILVDDGSPDRCPQICDEYAAAHANVRVVHKQNGGLSSARNAGLEAATGAWIMFVDSDDIILPEMLTDLMAEAQAHNYDIVGSNLASYQGKRRIMHYVSKRCEFSGNEILCAFLLKNIDLSSCTKIYRREIIGDARFPLNRRSEDFPFLVEVYGKQPRAAYLPVGYYQYRSTPGSITNVFNKNFFDQLTNIEEAAALKQSADAKVARAYTISRNRLYVDVAKEILLHKATKQYNQEFKRCINTINSQALHLLTFQSGWKYVVKYIAVSLFSLFK